MEWNPTSAKSLSLVAMVVACAGGCQNQSSSSSVNPFLAPNRVPPPATRAIAPGQAQPYYPGDPLPVMQSNAASAIDANGLAWGGPNGSSATLSVADSAAPPASRAVFAESSVAIPTDNDALRFELPAAIAQESATPLISSPAQTAGVVDTSVTQASYTEPMTHAPTILAAWQQPQVAQAGASPFVVHPGQASTQPPVVAQGVNVMEVRLRAVPSPPPEPGPAPRIRLPGQVESAASLDGFRPRSSMR